MTGDPQVAVVQAAAAAQDSVELLAVATAGCVACPELAAGRTTVVPGDFPAAARLLLVGEAPGAAEDASGRPFVGKAGQLLDQLLAEAGLDRGGLAVANVLKCRPPGNRPPARAEVRRCRGWLDRQVELLAPPVLVTLGATALGWALGPAARLTTTRGRVHEWHGRRLVTTYHPSAALRFGPRGAPMAALRDDLRLAATLL